MKNKDKTKAELIKELKTLRKEREKSALNDFTEHKQIEEEYLSFTKDILDASAVGIFILDSDFKVVWINHSTEKYFGLQREKVIGKDKRELIKKNIQHIFEDPDEFIRKVFVTYDNNTYVEKFECHVLPKRKRKERWLEHWNQPIKSGLYAGGRIEYYYDITKYKQAKQITKKSEKRFKELFNHMSSGVAIYEAKNNGGDFIFRSCNRAAEKIEKVKKEDIIGKSVLKVFPGVKDFGLFKVFQEVYKTGKPQHHPISLYKDQRITGWRENYIYKLPSGEIVAVYDDITERKKAEEQIKDSEERLKILFDYAPDAYYISDLKGNFIDGNIAAEKLIGYKKEELIGKNFLKLKLLSLADIPKAVKLLAKNLRRLPTGPNEFVLNRKDNSKVIVEISTYPVKIKGRTLVLGIARDITERKKAEKEIRLHAAMMDNVAEGVYLIGLDDLRIKWTNEKFARMFGYDPGEMVGKQVDIVNAPTEGAPTDTRISIVDVLKETGEWHGEVRNIKRDGTHFWCYANVSLFDHPEYGKVIVSVHTDITERKQAEEELSKERTLLKAIIDKIPVLLTRYDPDTDMLYLNKEFEKIVGWKTEEIKDIDLMEKVYPDPDYRKQAMEYMQKSSTEWREFRIQSKSGKIINSEWSNIRLDDGTQIGIGIDVTERKQTEERLKKTMNATIETVSKIIEAKDPYTAGHQLRVSQLTTAIAKELNLSQDKIKGIRVASLIHDIGKISVPTEILSKSIALSDIEFSLIKGHSQIGYDILKSIEFPWPIEKIVLQHHERLNGSGYPQGLKADKIMTEAKIIGVADVVEAMSSHRPYRPALGIDAALEEISKNRGLLYDSKVVDACLKLFQEKGFKFK